MQKIFVTNRPNYCHKKFAEAARCKFFHVRHYIRENIPVVSLPMNGILNSRKLPDADVYFSESIMDYYPVYYKNRGSKVMLIAEDTIFKLGGMQKFKKDYILKMLNSANGFIAISDLCRRMVLEYVKKPVRVAYPFPHEEFFRVKSNLKNKNILFVGRNDPTKGFRELVKAVRMLRQHDKDWNLYLVGECSSSVKQEPGIYPMGFVKDMSPYFKKCSFFVHPAAFDPCPATVFEAMNAGMITVISKNIGQTDIFMKNKLSSLVLDDTNHETIWKKLLDLSNHSEAGKISTKLRNVSKGFREKKRVQMFRKEFDALLEEIV